jgi:hypothetical protein
MVSIEKFSVLVDDEAEDSCLLIVLYQFSTSTYVNARMIITPNGTTFPAKQIYLQGWRRMGSP